MSGHRPARPDTPDPLDPDEPRTLRLTPRGPRWDGAAIAALEAALVVLLAADVPESEPIEHPVSVRAATALDAIIARLIVIRLVVRW